MVFGGLLLFALLTGLQGATRCLFQVTAINDGHATV